MKLSNHLTDVHQLDDIQRRKYLQEAKLQPKVKVVIYHDTENSKDSSNHVNHVHFVGELQSNVFNSMQIQTSSSIPLLRQINRN